MWIIAETNFSLSLVLIVSMQILCWQRFGKIAAEMQAQ
jgi:hypothetical protein